VGEDGGGHGDPRGIATEACQNGLLGKWVGSWRGANGFRGCRKRPFLARPHQSSCQGHTLILRLRAAKPKKAKIPITPLPTNAKGHSCSNRVGSRNQNKKTNASVEIMNGTRTKKRKSESTSRARDMIGSKYLALPKNLPRPFVACRNHLILASLPGSADVTSGRRLKFAAK